MSLCDDRLYVTTGHSVSLCLIPLERLTLTHGQTLSPSSALGPLPGPCSVSVCLLNMAVFPFFHLCVMLAYAPVSLCVSFMHVCL